MVFVYELFFIVLFCEWLFGCRVEFYDEDVVWVGIVDYLKFVVFVEKYGWVYDVGVDGGVVCVDCWIVVGFVWMEYDVDICVWFGNWIGDCEF